jgi:predicted transcriptional regulator
MKTAISVPDALFERAERAAHRLGRSRSALYAEALSAYLVRLEAEPDEVTAALDELYADAPEAAAAGAAAGRRLIDSGGWDW